MNPTTSEKLHADPANWKLGIFYFCREDLRVIVPKRIRGLGWTINFARPSAFVWMAVIILFVLSTLALARRAGATADMLLTIKLVLAFGIIAGCHRAANSSLKS